MGSKLKSALVLAITLLFIKGGDVRAATPPNFPTCSNPTGELIVKYDNGDHGIVGDPSLRSGSDNVYLINDEQVMQCFCAVDGNGIQTNWWKVSSLTDSEIQTLKNLGWIFVPNGRIWGLSDSAYMAKNEQYSCKSSSTSTGGSITNTAASTSASSGQVLGFATTGSTWMVGVLALLSGTSFVLGVVSRRLKR